VTAVPSPSDVACDLRRWLAERADELQPFNFRTYESLEEQYDADLQFLELLAADGWTKWGWPEWCGGAGGTAEHRGVLCEELHRAGLHIPLPLIPIDTLLAPIVQFAPELARRFVPGYLAGHEHWCQAFSEPDAGSDLPSLRTRAVRDGDVWRLSGQKVWSSRGVIATRTTVLARTGTPESRHRGLTMLFVDTNTPGVTVRPIRTINGRHELSEMFFDDVLVPADRVIGEVDGGWRVVTYTLQYERGMYGWYYQGKLHQWLDYALSRTSTDDAEVAVLVGETHRKLTALRLASRDTVQRLSRGDEPGAEISREKVLLAWADQAVTALARRLLAPMAEFDDSEEADALRSMLFFTRASTLMGGTLEMQRNTVAEHVLGLPRGG
jgi:alkylation response protein AidB-like acyl-CoA dehydrogenase